MPLRTCALLLLILSPVALAQREATPEERFRRADRNGDGVLTRDEVPRAELFARLDKNGDGKVTPAEAQAVGGGQRGARALPAGVVAQRDIAYHAVAGVDARHLSLDLYKPAKATGAPVMIYVHGGGWKKGDKAAVGHKVSYFCGQRGWLLVSINYRLLPAGKHPVNVQDVARAIAWVHDNARAHGGDPDKLLLMGHSAGAHLAALAATDGRRLAALGKSLAILKACVELDTGALDVPRQLESNPGFYTPIFGQDPAVWRDASPFHHVAAGKHIPPFFCVHADRKRTKQLQAEAFAKALRAASVEAVVVAAPDKTHASLNRELGAPGDAITAKLQAFLDRALRAAKPAPSSRSDQESALDEALR